MNSGPVSAILQLISAAVTPVVMISACATLILGINSKHSALSAHIRAALSECRLQETSEPRRAQLREQIAIFYRRFLLTWFALGTIYGAVCTFVFTVLLIVFSQKGQMTFNSGALTLFLLGVMLMLLAACLELAEIALSVRSLRVEMRDVLPPPHPRTK